LSQPAAWRRVAADVDARLGAATVKAAEEAAVEHAYFLHLAGSTAPLGPAASADPGVYTEAFLLNAGSTIALGQAFLAACARREVPGTLVVCSSPAATDTIPGLSQYSAAKAAVEHWLRVVAAEQRADPRARCRVIAVVPHAVDTPMVRGVMAGDPASLPLAGYFDDLARSGGLATPAQAAEHIWEAALDPDAAGSVVPVGARHLARRTA
ncbi:SDR family oxidoreductase, partial [Nonomuraea lactucae]|uniref:SDR family oxidoreductase n=1 Tax=Nonomuraea lactucae TaxID=2249762 RepID=UPI000DE55BEA